MENHLKLFMLLLGCKPEGKFIEQHDIFFGIGNSIKDLIPQINKFWPEAKGKIHIDVWREIIKVDDFYITIIPKKTIKKSKAPHLFFLNLGGYKKKEFEEYHYRMLTVAKNLTTATKKAKETVFYKHYGFKGAVSHIDDKYGIDVDDVYKVSDVIAVSFKEYSIAIQPLQSKVAEDILHIGYLKLEKI